MRPPVFVVGCPRSGTTLVNFILNKNERCFLLNEKGLYAEIYRRFHLQRSRGNDPKEVFRRVARQIISAHSECELMTEDQISDSIRTADPCWSSLLSEFMETLASLNRPSAQFWGDKTPRATFYVDAMIENHPNARIVYVRRHPLHVVESLSRSSFPHASNSPLLNSFVVKKYVDAFEDVRDLIPEDQLFEVAYESLLEDPEQICMELCQFLNLEYQPEMLQSAPTKIRTLFGWPESKSWEPIRPQASSREAGRNVLVESYLRDVMERYEYDSRPLSLWSYLRAVLQLVPFQLLNAAYNQARAWKYPTYRFEVLQKMPSMNRLRSWVSQ